jgi:hypothetical protein
VIVGFAAPDSSVAHVARGMPASAAARCWEKPRTARSAFRLVPRWKGVASMSAKYPAVEIPTILTTPRLE